MSVYVIDYGMGNLVSVQRALEECGAIVSITKKPEEISKATHIILPGVGAFADGMANLKERGWVDAIHRAVSTRTIHLMGICLGMQLLSDIGYEGGGVAGLGLIPGRVEKMVTQSDERIPHVGWNELSIQKDDSLFHQISDKSDFYFVHSYHFITECREHVLATTPYCNSFNSAVRCENVYGVQFHPEKSQRTGFQILKNFLAL